MILYFSNKCINNITNDLVCFFVFKKKEVDAKAALKLVATRLSNKSFQKVVNIIERVTLEQKKKVPLSRFTCLYALSKKTAESLLEQLQSSQLTKKDWTNFYEKVAESKGNVVDKVK
jgi:hypothetical protein